MTRPPLEDEFLVEMIATGVCHTDISGYGGIYPRVLGHEGTLSLPYNCTILYF
jgi:Zn-dependent alcohol dehydrogenase